MAWVPLAQVLQEAACADKPHTQLAALQAGIPERLADMGETRNDGKSELSQRGRVPSRSLWWGEYTWWLYTRAQAYLPLIPAPCRQPSAGPAAPPDCLATNLKCEPAPEPTWLGGWNTYPVPRTRLSACVVCGSNNGSMLHIG